MSLAFARFFFGVTCAVVRKVYSVFHSPGQRQPAITCGAPTVWQHFQTGMHFDAEVAALALHSTMSRGLTELSRVTALQHLSAFPALMETALNTGAPVHVLSLGIATVSPYALLQQITREVAAAIGGLANLSLMMTSSSRTPACCSPLLI